MTGQPADFSAMTVNERLFAAGMLDQFDEAVRRGDRVRMIEILTSVELAQQATDIADTVLRHPTRYGRSA